MFRRYTIDIEINEAAATNAVGVVKRFGCSVSEPSSWVEYGTTKERSLTFLDQNGQELNSSVFPHQPYFNSLADKMETEIDEIKEFIYSKLSEHFHLAPDNVEITVAEYSRL